MVCSASRLTFVMTAKCAIMSRILNQMPMFSARSATARRVSQTNFCASSRISTQLLSSAKKGARGKAATKMVMKPNCKTGRSKEQLDNGGDLVVSVLAFCSNDPSSNPTGYVYLNLLYKKGIK